MRTSHIGQFKRSKATLTSQLTTIEDELCRYRAKAKLDAVDLRMVAVGDTNLQPTLLTAYALAA